MHVSKGFKAYTLCRYLYHRINIRSIQLQGQQSHFMFGPAVQGLQKLIFRNQLSWLLAVMKLTH